MRFIFEAIRSMFVRLTALINFQKTGRSGRSSVKFGTLLVAFGLLLGLILVGCAPASSSGASGNGPTMPMGMTIDETADCVVGSATACTFAVGDMFTGEVGSTDDPSDWVKVDLLADTSYRITATPGTAGTTADLHIHTDGSTPETAADPDIGNDNLYTATTAAVHYIEVGLSVAGGYELTIAAAPEGNDACNSADAEGDCDGDDTANLTDTCPRNATGDHADPDEDGMGNECDPDDDGDGVNDLTADGTTPLDKFPLNACATTNSDSDALPDEIITSDRCTADEIAALADLITAAGTTCTDRDSCTDPDDDDDGVNDLDDDGMILDEFPLDDSRSCTVTATNRTSATLNCDNDVDSSNVAIANNVDIDDDGDGLIELATEAELNNIRWDLDGSHYDDSGTDEGTTVDEADGSSMGCPTGGCTGYELVNDITLSTHADWMPFAGSSNRFTAIFEGNGYVVDGLAIDSDSGTTPLGFLNFAALVRNLHIAGSITRSGGEAVSIGGLSATSTNTYNIGAAVNISTSVPVASNALSIGGLVGRLSDGSIRNSWSSGTVTVASTVSTGGKYSLGGLIGTILNDTGDGVQNSYATGAVMGSNAANVLGGLIGQLLILDLLVNIYATGMVTGGSATNTIGGLVGESFSGSSFGDPLTAVRSSYHRMGNAVVGTGDTDRMFVGRAGQNPPDISAQALADLQTPTANTGIYSNWSTDNWDFGTASQLPALKFAEHEETLDSDCTPVPAGGKVTATALRPSATAQPYCGELLPMQPGR